MRPGGMVLAGMVLAAGAAAPALAEVSYLVLYASPGRVYFVETGSEKGLPPALSINAFVVIDPPTDRGIGARTYTVSIDCAANTFTIAGLVSLDRELKQLSTDPEPTQPAAVGGAFGAIRNYLCDGKIPAGASRYGSLAEAQTAGLAINSANRSAGAGQ
jgi:hypothetical protein